MTKTKEKLRELREDIDRIDGKIATLMRERFSLADEIGKTKKRNKMKIENTRREKIVLAEVKKLIKGNKQKKAILNIYKEIIKQTKRLEK